MTDIKINAKYECSGCFKIIDVDFSGRDFINDSHSSCAKCKERTSFRLSASALNKKKYLKSIPVVKVFHKPNPSIKGEDLVSFWCSYCQKIHRHGGKVRNKVHYGHRVAHCSNPNSPYKLTGYYMKRYTKKEKDELGIQ